MSPPLKAPKAFGEALGETPGCPQQLMRAPKAFPEKRRLLKKGF